MRASDVPRRPQLRRVHLGELSDGDPDLLEPNTDLEGVSYRGLRYEKLDIGMGSVINGCEFDGVAADVLVLANSRVVETRFHQVAVPAFSLGRAVLRDVEFEGSRLGAIEAFDLDARSLHFKGCRITYLNLRGAKLLDIAFTDCIIDEIDFAQGDARRFAFPGTRLGALALHNTKVADFDLRGAEVGSVSGWASLAGATVSADQLTHLGPQMAAELGLRVT